MLKKPAAVPPFDPSRSDMRLPDAALKFRIDNRINNMNDLRRLNITAWLYRDKQGAEGILVNPNTTIAELQAQFGPADTRDAEVGIHSEGRAAEYFRTHRELQVTQIFTERVPCRQMCAPLLGNYFPGVPVFYYFDRSSWGGTKSAGDILAGIYGIVDVRGQSLAQIFSEYQILRNLEDSYHSEHRTQLNNYRRSWNPMAHAVQALNPVKAPELTIWDETQDCLKQARSFIAAGNVMKAGAFLIAARMQYLVALRKYVRWIDKLDAAAHRTYVAITVVSIAAIGAAVAAFAAGGAAVGAGAVGGTEAAVGAEAGTGAVITTTEGAAANASAEQTFYRLEEMSSRLDAVLRAVSTDEEAEAVADSATRVAAGM